jgi:hypothetical protein
MSLRRQKLFCATTIFNLVILASAIAQSQTNRTSELLPPMPSLKSPVDFFRNLLAMTPGERRQALSNRPPEVRDRILSKLREYASLDPNRRELRLRATELQWYLQPFMSEPKADREARLALIPNEIRKLVEDRLARWDVLPPAIQEEMINDEMASRYFSQIELDPTNKDVILRGISPERRAKLEEGLDRWRNLLPEEREMTLQRFNAFFELTTQEREKALNTLSEVEQRQMEKTLEAYAKLPVQQRVQCIKSFEKFTSMTLADRQEFLKNAERWKLMTPEERESWRTLVRFAPLQPPDLNQVTFPLPPKTPPIHLRSGRIATNQSSSQNSNSAGASQAN